MSVISNSSMSASVSGAGLDTTAKPAANNLAQAAEQFEALFLQQVLKSMRKAGDVLASDAMRSRDMDTMRDFYDGVLAENLAKQKTVGIADMLEQQLGGQVGTGSLNAPLRAEWNKGGRTSDVGREKHG